MARSGGVTVSAVVVLIGSALTIFGGAMMVLGSVFLLKLSPSANVPGNAGYIVLIEAAVLFGFGGWGLAAGIGLLNLKQWARVSTLVFAAILIFISLPTAMVLAFIPFPMGNDPRLPANFETILRAGMVLFYATLSALGAFWLYFFNRRAVKAQFIGEHRSVETIVSNLPLDRAMAGQTARPVSITIIGWFLLIGSAFTPLGLLFNSHFFPGMQLPLCFMGGFFFGRSAFLILIIWMAAQMVAAVGLLKLKNWGRLATIALQCVGLINVALLVGSPANRARFQELMDAMFASMQVRMPQPMPLAIPMWAGLLSSLPIVFVVLFFLITRKQAFFPSERETAL